MPLRLSEVTKKLDSFKSIMDYVHTHIKSELYIYLKKQFQNYIYKMVSWIQKSIVYYIQELNW